MRGRGPARRKKKHNEKPKNRERDKLCAQNKSAEPSQLNNKSPSNRGSARALEHWIPMWCPAESCVVLGLYLKLDFLCQRVRVRERQLLNLMCAGAFLTNSFGFSFTPSLFIGAEKTLNVIGETIGPISNSISWCEN